MKGSIFYTGFFNLSGKRCREPKEKFQWFVGVMHMLYSLNYCKDTCNSSMRLNEMHIINQNFHKTFKSVKRNIFIMFQFHALWVEDKTF